MATVEQTARTYEELADKYAELGDEPMRDRFLVLAADSFLTAGQKERGELLRQKLLQFNPHHLLRPYGSLAEAMKSADVRNYVAGLRRNYPPEKLGQFSEHVRRMLATPRASVPSASQPPPTPGGLAPASILKIQDRPGNLSASDAAKPASTVPGADIYSMLPISGPARRVMANMRPTVSSGSWLCLLLFWISLIGGLAAVAFAIGKPFLTMP
jgi:hypothetical protein